MSDDAMFKRRTDPEEAINTVNANLFVKCYFLNALELWMKLVALAGRPKAIPCN